MGLKILGQVRPSSGVTGSLYQVTGPAVEAVVSNIIICNTDAALEDDFIIYQVKAAGSPSVDNQIFAGKVPAGESYVVIAGLSLAVGESIRYYSHYGRMTFTCSGNES